MVKWNTDAANYRLIVRGCQYPVSLGSFRLEARDNRGNEVTFDSVRFMKGVECDRGWVGRMTGETVLTVTVHPVLFITFPRVNLRDFWLICQEVRKTKTPEPAVDWLHEFGPPVVRRLLDQGVPDGDEVFPPG